MLAWWKAYRKLCIEILKVLVALVFMVFFFGFLYILQQNSEAFRDDCESKGFRVLRIVNGSSICVDPKMIKDIR